MLSGRSRDLQVLSARGLLPLPPEELIPLQVALTRADDEEIRRHAAESLRRLDPKIAADSISEQSDPEVVSYLAFHLSHPVVLHRVLQLRQLPAEVMKALAPGLPAESQEILLLRQDAIVQDPSILDALEGNPLLSSYSRRRIAEYREHLIPRRPSRRAEPVAEGARETAAAEEAIAEPVAEEPAEEIPVDFDLALEKLHELTESEIRTLPTPVRLKLSRGASRTLRNILIRDNSPVIALSVLNNNPLSESEVEQIAASRSVCDEVLEQIGRSRQWVRKYEIAAALVGNPRTPVGLAVRLLPRLSVRDLRNLSRDRNVPEAVRSRAARLYRIKQQ